jgi:hypothetical protein
MIKDRNVTNEPASEKKRENAESLRLLIDEALLKGSSDNPHNFFLGLGKRVTEAGLGWDPEAILEYWWWLARIGVIAFPGGELRIMPLPGPLPKMHLTERGRKLLERGQESPHNPDRFYKKIRERIGSPDDIVMEYLDEAVGAWAVGLNRASAVMLGCACEQLVLLLAQAVSTTKVPPYSDRIKGKLERASDSPIPISQLFDDVRKALLQLASDKKLPGPLRDALDRKLTPIFEQTRGLRNQAGHPTAVEVTSDEAEANLLLFPSFYFLIDDLIKQL